MQFGLIGVGGYVAPRHMKAIKELGHELVVALDPNDSVGVLDSYFPDCKFFTSQERFDRHIIKIKTICWHTTSFSWTKRTSLITT